MPPSVSVLYSPSLRQTLLLPVRHVLHVPPLISGSTVTRVPAAGPVAPARSTHPDISWPMTNGAFARGCLSCKIARSVPQIPLYATLTSAQPTGTSGIATSVYTTSSVAAQTAAFIVPLMLRPPVSARSLLCGPAAHREPQG